MRRRRLAGVLTTPLGSVGAALLAMVVLLQGLGVPGVAYLAGLPSLSLLSRSGPLGGLSPLSDDVVRRALGLPPLLQREAPVSSPVTTFTSVMSGGRASGRSGEADQAVVLAHRFDNDAFGAARAVPSVPYTATTDTRGQTRESGEPTSCAPVGGTAWYQYTAPSDQALFVDTFGTRYADSVGVFTGSSLAGLRQVACGSSTSGATQTGFLARRGVTYWFQVAGTIGGGVLTFHLVPVGTTQTVNTDALYAPALSGDGRVAAFVGLPPGPGSGARLCASSSGRTVYCQALYVADLVKGEVRLVVSTHPEVTAVQYAETNAVIQSLSSSGTGRYVSFASDDSELVPNDSNLVWDVFVADTKTGRIERVSVASDGSQAAFDPTSNTETSNQPNSLTTSPGSLGSTISLDGRWVTFYSDANNLAGGDAGGTYDVFRHDRVTSATRLLSVGKDGRRLADGASVTLGLQSMSADGSRVAFVHGFHAEQSSPI